MSCPTEAALTLRAVGEVGDLSDGWTDESVDRHLAECEPCRRALHELVSALSAWRDVDVVDTGRFDDEYFSELAEEVVRAVGEGDDLPNVVPLRRRRGAVGLLAAVSALAALLVLGLRMAPDAGSPSLESGDQAALLEEGRALGRELLADALDEPPVETLLATALGNSDLLGELEDDQWSFSTTLRDDLDELSDAELHSLILRL